MAELQLNPNDKTNYTVKFLKAASFGIVVSGAVVAPNILSLLAKSLKDSPDNKKMLRAARHAKTMGWITYRETPKGVEVALTESGKLKWAKEELSTPLHDKRWDKKWRFIIFDIPVAHKNKADAFRLALRQLGIKQYQRSIWVTPYKCQTQVSLIRQMYGLTRYVQMIEASAVENEESLKRKFKLI